MNLEKTIMVPLIISINQGLKRLGLSSKLCIPVSWALGVLGSILFDSYTSSNNIFISVVEGLIYGSTASGLYDATKITIRAIRDKT